jgi:homoaconitase/3-isopropylmalate dehydratase large subunit
MARRRLHLRKGFFRYVEVAATLHRNRSARCGRTLLAKIWDQHVIIRISEDTDLLHVDRHLLHDLGGSRGLLDLKSRDLALHNPELTFATPDHAISTARGRAGTRKLGRSFWQALGSKTSASGIAILILTSRVRVSSKSSDRSSA